MLDSPEHPVAAKAVVDMQAKLAVRDLTRTQGTVIALACLTAGIVFILIGVKNIIDGDLVMAAVCGLATLVSLVYGWAFYRRAPRPISDFVLTVTALVIVGITIDERGLTGVLWCYPTILFFHLIAQRNAAMVFNIGAIAVAILISYLKYDGSIAFRVGITLLVGSALAIVYARILHSQQALQEEQHRRLELLLRCSNIGSLEWESATGIATLSDRLKDMLGIATNVVAVDMTIGRHVHAEDRERVEQALRDLVAPPALPDSVRQSAPLNFRIGGKHGERLWVHVDATAIFGGDGRAEKLIASFLDVTPLLSAEESTRAALQRQTELNELRSRFVAMTSHEFRTPLAAILSSAELLKHYGDRLPAGEKAAVLDIVSDGVQRMTYMLDRILLISKAEAKMLEFKPRQIDLRELCGKLLDDARVRQPESGCHLVADFSFGSEEGVFDEKLLRHIVDNLLSNAVKYSPEGGEVRLRVYREQDKMVFEVTDHGIGIPASDIANLFDSFHRAGNVGDIKGTGLGLSIVKSSVELHGGSIEVRSVAGEGSCFVVRL